MGYKNYQLTKMFKYHYDSLHVCKHCDIMCLFRHVFSDLSFAGVLLFFQIKLITKNDFTLSGCFGNVIEEDEIQIKEEK